MGFLDKIKEAVPIPKALDPEMIQTINDNILSVAETLQDDDASLGEMAEDEIKGKINEAVYTKIEPKLDNAILKKLAEKAIEKAIDKLWDKIKEKIASSIEEE